MTFLIPILFWVPTLFDQSVARILETNFPEAQFLLMSVKSGQLLGARWPQPDRPIPLGSLTKPFLMVGKPDLATCDPKQCWLPKGHGELGWEDAIAHSCNSYFLQRATGEVRYPGLQASSRRPEVLIGLGSDWQIPPLRLMGAYAALATDPQAGAIRLGMRRSSLMGTARLLRIDALAKTGTAPCSHAHKAPGDGYVAILYPPESPRYVLLVQVHGVTGAVAAGTAGEMLTVLRDGK